MAVDQAPATDDVGTLDVTTRTDAVRQLIELQEETHVRIAERLHDGPVQVLTAASLRVGLLRRGADEADEPRLAEVERLIVHALHDLRREMDEHRAPLEMSPDLAGSLRSLLHRHEFHERLHVTTAGPDAPPVVATLFYRVVQMLLFDGVVDAGVVDAPHVIGVVVSSGSASLTVPVRPGRPLAKGSGALLSAVNGQIESMSADQGRPATVTFRVPFSPEAPIGPIRSASLQ